MKNHSGLTLIEVLIALVILSIALTAIIHATSQSILNTRYLQNKMEANWLATRLINETRTGLIKPPLQPNHLEKKIEFLDQTWDTQATLVPTANPHIFKVSVKVKLKSHDLLAELTSYIYAA